MRPDYFKAILPVASSLTQDSLIALLADEGFDGFEQTPEALIAYTHEETALTSLEAICRQYDLTCHTETLPAQNWNEVWESNFQPVVIPGFCAVLAPFHPAAAAVDYTIRIMPKMSFGTGHHATTSMMLESLRHLDLNGKTVLDFGAGTGVLAILAKMKGAAEVTAIDNDDWAFENCRENVSANQTEVTVLQGSLEAVAGRTYDLILANINRHILLQYMDAMHGCLNPGGQLLLSGILAEDEPVIRESARAAGFIAEGLMEKKNWLCLSFLAAPEQELE